jgi:hypothetical protein
VATAPPTTATTMTSAPASTATAFTLRACFVHDERATEKIFPVQGCDSFFSFSIILDFGEAKSARLSRKTIAKQSEGIGLHTDFRKQRPYLLFGSFER